MLDDVAHESFSIADARRELGDLLNRAHYTNERITVTKRDKPFASVNSVKDQQHLDYLDQIARKLGITVEVLLNRMAHLAEDRDGRSVFDEISASEPA
ncbi:MAG: type II toxin-antitoxin system prevent-host-death family antitoxin [Pseudomonadota bacterium]